MPQDDRLTIKQISQELEVDERTVRRWIKNKQLHVDGYDIRGRYRIKREDLNTFIEQKTKLKDGEGVEEE